MFKMSDNFGGIRAKRTKFHLLKIQKTSWKVLVETLNYRKVIDGMNLSLKDPKY